MDDDDLDELLDQLSGDDDDDDDEIGDVSIGGQEIIGAEEIIGAMLGAKKRKRNRAKQLSAKMRAARNIDPNAVALVRSSGGPRRRKVLAGVTTSIGAGATAVVLFEAQENFRPEEFFVQGTNIASFLINSIKIGTEEQFVNTGACPADVFSSGALRSKVHFKTMNLGTVCAVTVTNTSAGALTFNSAFIGTAVD